MENNGKWNAMKKIPEFIHNPWNLSLIKWEIVFCINLLAQLEHLRKQNKRTFVIENDDTEFPAALTSNQLLSKCENIWRFPLIIRIFRSKFEPMLKAQ